MCEEELTQEAFDKMKERLQVLEEMLFVEMKLTADRTDISACEKVNRFKSFIEQVRASSDAEQDLEQEEVITDKVKEPSNGNQRDENNLKRSASDSLHPDAPSEKISKDDGLSGDDKNKEATNIEGRTINPGEFSDDEGAAWDCCVVCGLHRGVFKEDMGRELHHYLSHGFNILKEFDVLKPDDSLFLICNICNSPFPRKCHVNFRKHLVAEHTEKIVEIFRDAAA